jgi:CRP-like cAMP-binding protein
LRSRLHSWERDVPSSFHPGSQHATISVQLRGDLEPTPNSLIRKIENFLRLSDAEKQAIEAMCSDQTHVGDRRDVVREGDVPDTVHLLIDGFACRYKVLPNGRRQIIAHFVPGDFCNLRAFILSEMDHNVGTLSPVTLATIKRKKLIQLTDEFPRITQAFWWSAMVDEAITREWIVNVGSRTAVERVAHLICEHFLRMQAVGLAVGYSVQMPITQNELGDTLGLSTVHVNRTLQQLRADRLIALRGKMLTILDLRRLQDIALFNPNYLHFLHRSTEMTVNDRARAEPANGNGTIALGKENADGSIRRGPPY